MSNLHTFNNSDPVREYDFVGMDKIKQIRIDKIQRKGIRIQDLLDETNFEIKVRKNIEDVNLTLTKIYDHSPLVVDEILDEFSTYKDIVANHIADASLLIANAIKNKK